MIDVLLATYNGARYLPALLASLEAQTYREWRLIARDDGSSDDTLSILECFAQTHPDQVTILRDGDRGLGARGNFARLLEYSTAAYVMFCDQDDVWKPNKTELTLQRIQELERQYGSTTPLLVHTDLEVVGEGLEPLAPSFWRYQNLNPDLAQWNRLLVQNVVTGCTAMINQTLRELAVPIPPEAIMHDWWLALVTALFGRIEVVYEPTVRYRQHGTNDTGAKAWSLLYVTRKALSFWQRRALAENLQRTQHQAKVLLARYQDLDPAVGQTLESYAALDSMGFFERRLFLLRNRILKQGWVRNLGLLLRV